MTRSWGAEGPTGRLRAVALCEPQYFDIGSVINTWHRSHQGKRSVDRAKASRQFADLVSLFRSLTIETHFITPIPGCPYQVFTRDTGVVLGAGAVLTEPTTPVRRPEAEATRELLTRLNIPIIETVRGEGGDVVFLSSDCVAVARSSRTPTDSLALALARHSPQLRVREVTHKSSTHLDTVFAVLDLHTCVVTPSGISDSLQRLIEDTFSTVITLDDRSLETLANNFVVVSPGAIVASTSSPEQNRLLESHGITVHTVDLSEFSLSGAGPRCMTLEIFREHELKPRKE